MSTAITTTSPDMAAIEEVLISGNLAKLTPPQRVAYYNRVCESIGVNPLTRPFEYIVLNDKLQLYARKDCTDQLRSGRRVSIAIVSKEKIDDVYVVTARATTPDGRADEATGAVNLTNLKGENLANALMKAETKAKRRVTLSICGLGFTDESEVGDIPNARPANIDPQTGEIHDPIVQEVNLVTLEEMIDKATSLDELKSIAKDINEAGKAGRIAPDVRKALGEKYKARTAALNGAAA